MGKRRHNQDKMWISNIEMTTDWGGKNVDAERVKQRQQLIKLPFSYCNISMTPFRDPYATEDGVIFDLLNIVPYLRKHNRNPMTGAPMQQADLIKLNFFKNEQG